jgi:hypothetical protein
MKFAKTKNKRAVIELLIQYGATPPPDHKLKAPKASVSQVQKDMP